MIPPSPSSSPSRSAATATSTLVSVTPSPRHRSVSVLLLSSVSVVACFLWWGRLPFNAVSSTTNSEHQWLMKRNKVSNTNNDKQPPPYLFQSDRYTVDDDDYDDEEHLTRDDDSYQQGERIRGPPSVDTNTDNNNNNKDGNKKQKIKENSDNNNNTQSASDLYYSWEDTSATRPRPKVVWLMSYPNSGTSYTMTMVARASGHATASNYGREVTVPPTFNRPIYPEQLEGPYYKPNPRHPLPRDYILVKTHCGGRCVPCGPDQYLVNETSFLEECTRGSGLLPDNANLHDPYSDNDEKDNTNQELLDEGFRMVHYNASIVRKAIHLIRNPFDNIVSRFHLERKHWVSQNRQDYMDRYDNNATGFQLWCQDMNQQYGPTNSDSGIPSDIVQLMEPIPCHGEFYKYTQWHNMANAVIANQLKGHVMIVHYENYEKKWNDTATKILDYLHLEMQGKEKPFHARHDYDPYFNSSQRKSAKALVKRLAKPAVWEQVKRYFVN